MKFEYKVQCVKIALDGEMCIITFMDVESHRTFNFCVDSPENWKMGGTYVFTGEIG